MKSFIIPIVSAVILGYICANYVINEYENPNNDNSIYFLQIGVSDKEDNDKYKDIKNKITIKENNLYYTYIGITMDKNIANKIKKIYRNNDIDIYVKKKKYDNDTFISQLEQYDILLKNVTSKQEIDNILNSILSTFEENLNN